MTASQRSAVPPFIAMDVMRVANGLAAEGRDIIHLEVGQPSSPAPPRVLDAARAALATDRLGYTNALGVEALRRRIARHYGEYYDIDIDWRRVVVTAGSSAGFVLMFLAAFDAGERVGVVVPGYPAYRHILSALGISVVPVPVDWDDGFRPTPRHLQEIAQPIRGLVVASPANPTGAVVAAPAMAELAAWCRANRVQLISDEIYHGITYDRAAATALAFDDDALIVGSFSKYFAMTGWRLGWLVAPPGLLRPLECLAQNFYISPPTLSQLAAITALDCRDDLDDLVRGYRRNRDILAAGLPAAGFPRLSPGDGAFYLYADVSHRTDDSAAFCRRLLEETGVAITPGIDFDADRGHRHVRISYAGSTSDMEEALRRLGQWGR